MHDARHDKLANLLVNYSCEVQPGEKVLIECYDTPIEFIDAIVKAVYAAGGYPLLELKYNRLLRTMLKGASKESLASIQDSELHRMKNMDAFIGVRGVTNAKELSDVPSDKNALWGTEVFQPVHANERVPNTKWVVLRYPTPAMAMMADMSTEAFEEYYFNVTANVDYKKMSKAMDPAAEYLRNADQVHITGPGTDIKFSIKDIGAVKCDGQRNIPDGEVYSCPVRDSVNGTIRYNTPSSYHGFTFKDIELTFENGKIVKATANDTKRINEILDTDEGARYIGEFALGCNPAIDFAMDEILFDEKIGGSFHFTPGNAYDDTDNGNRSAVHWDLVLIQTPEYGGGEIRMDGDLIRKDGSFVHPAFVGLNPDKLMG
ncbi:MAG TPA: aminopeptidase [Bacteroidetes bacterium]|nr:aminopeptidase T [bacterium BMS3Bbin04]HDO64840.1 aminopeptidase [Bacteroidota bacterium]HEX03965.1 aminopeptidase [Bacteroidota bacterium]